MTIAGNLTKSLLLASILFGAVFLNASMSSADSLCDINDPQCQVDDPGNGGTNPHDPNQPDPNPYDPNQPDPNPYDPDPNDPCLIDPAIPCGGGDQGDLPVVTEREISIGQRVSYRSLDLLTMLSYSLGQLPGYLLTKVEIELGNQKQNAVFRLIIDGGIEDSARGYRRQVVLHPVAATDLLTHGSAEIYVQGQVFIRKIRVQLRRPY